MQFFSQVFPFIYCLNHKFLSLSTRGGFLCEVAVKLSFEIRIWNTFALWKFTELFFLNFKDYETWQPLTNDLCPIRVISYAVILFLNPSVLTWRAPSFLKSDTAAFLIGFTARHNKEKIYFIVYMQYRGLRLKASSGLVVMLLSLRRCTKKYLWSVTSTLTRSRLLWNGTPLPERKGIIMIRNKWEINICL